MDIRTIKKLIELISETGVGEIEVKSGEESVRISRHTGVGPSPAPVVSHSPAAHFGDNQNANEASKAEKAKKNNDGHSVKAPMVGTVYLSSKPGAGPFVKVGDHVNVGDTLCLIEAMKMFNKIESDKTGVISARLIENEQAVEFDQALFIIEE